MHRLLPLLVATLVLAVGATWFLTRDSRQSVESHASVPVHETRPATDLPGVERDGAPEASAAPTGDDRLARPASDEAAEARQRREAAAGGGWWLDGTVELPAGAPEGPLGVLEFHSTERLRIEELVERSAASTEALRRSPVEGGKFRVHRENDERTYFLLDSHWLYLDEATSVRDERSVHLKPKLGARIIVTVSPPPGADPKDRVDGLVVRAEGSNPGETGLFSVRSELTRTAVCGADGVARLHGLSAELDWNLYVESAAWRDHATYAIEVSPGGTRHVAVQLELGARIAGRVTDEAGSAIPGARVSWMPRRSIRLGEDALPPVLTGADGRYEFRGLVPGMAVISAEADGQLPTQLAPRQLSDGDRLEGVDLVFSSGLAINGVVSLPDGSPAQGAIVRCALADELERWVSSSDASDRPDHAAMSDEHGHFHISGLKQGDYLVDAEHETVDGTRRRAERPAVPAGTPDLELTVAPPPGLTVRVVGPGGIEVRDATVLAWPWEASKVLSTSDFERVEAPEDLLRTKLANESGEYRLDGLGQGRWIVRALANGLVQALDPLEVGEGDTGETLVVQMLAAASIRGVLLDPNGEPAAGIGVHLEDTSQTRALLPALVLGGIRQFSISGEDGRFAFEPLRPGSYLLKTMQIEAGWAEMEPLGVVLREAQQLDDLELRLRRGGTLRGVIYDAEGRPEPGRKIMTMSVSGSGFVRDVVSDAQGEFLLEHLQPGTYQLVSEPDRAVMQADPDMTPADFMKLVRFATAQVADEEIVEVALGAPPESPVRIVGRVTRAGSPVTQGQITLIHEGSSMLDGLVLADLDADGNYALTAKRPGHATLIYSEGAGGLWGAEFHAAIPAVEEWRCDLDVPTGMIFGRVVDHDGDPLESIVVNVESRSGLPSLAGFGRGRLEVTDENGYFVFDSLPAGEYDARAGGELSPLRGNLYATRLVSGIALEEGGEHELEFVLEGSGELAGLVLDSTGRPVNGAAIFVRDLNGNPLSRLSAFSTDANGNFIYFGLPSGEVLVEARSEVEASRLQVVRVTAGDREPIELRLEPASVLTVRGEDANGEPTRIRLSVLDEAGREHCGMLSEADLEVQFATGLNNAERCIGPLLPGKYTVTGIDDEGREVRRTVTLKAERERLLRLRFAGS